MKAMVYKQYGSPDVLELNTVKKPEPKDDEVLVKLYTASINDWDWGLLRGKPFINRMMTGLRKPRRITVLGSDIAGRVEALGKNVRQFQCGDAVFGDLCGNRWGGFAEYVCAPADTLTLKPDTMSFEQAAALPQAALLAWQGLSGKNAIQPGDKVLINGAGGGSGSFAVQIAKSFGAEVTGVDSAEKFALMRSIGADQVIDYSQEDFTNNGKQYDLILDLMGYHSIFDYRRALSPRGRYVMVGGASGLIFQVLTVGFFLSFFGKKTMKILPHEPNKGMDHLKALFAGAKVMPVIDRCFALENLADAMRYFGERRSKGKVIIQINQDS